ncbi:hypothetical protein B0H13DRAFT_2077570 [Mycena leptocephala]|nr:hypothetical protein B0H13DRAFT_2077570 [Mycena leptocephala]
MWTVDGSGSVSLGLVSLRLVHIALLNVGLVCGVCGLRAQGNGGGRRETRRCARTRRGYSRRCWRWMLLSRRCEYGNTGGCDGGARCSPAPLPCPLPCSLLPCYRHAAQDLARTTTPGTGCVLVMGRPLVWMWGRPARGSVRLESGRRTKDDGLGSFRMRYVERLRSELFIPHGDHTPAGVRALLYSLLYFFSLRRLDQGLESGPGAEEGRYSRRAVGGRCAWGMRMRLCVGRRTLDGEGLCLRVEELLP